MGRAACPALLIVALVVGCGSPSQPTSNPVPVGNPPGPTVAPLRMLVLTATYGFRHDSIPTARQVLTQLGAQTGEFTVTATEDVGEISAARLASTDILFFALTTGELPFSDAQKAAILDFVNAGGGFMGAHSATDTLYDWGDYGRLVGAYFKEHPWTQDATVTVEGGSHPATRDLGASFRLFDEYYAFRDNPRSGCRCCSRSTRPPSARRATIRWRGRNRFGQGRSFYTALGHFQSTWQRSAVPGPSSWRHPLGREARVVAAHDSSHISHCHFFRARANFQSPVEDFCATSRVPRVVRCGPMSLLFRDCT